MDFSCVGKFPYEPNVASSPVLLSKGEQHTEPARDFHSLPPPQSPSIPACAETLPPTPDRKIGHGGEEEKGCRQAGRPSRYHENASLPLPILTQRRSQGRPKTKTQNGTCGVLRKDTLDALSFSVLHTKRSIRGSVGRTQRASYHTSNYFHHVVAPRCSGRGRDCEKTLPRLSLVNSA